MRSFEPPSPRRASLPRPLAVVGNDPKQSSIPQPTGSAVATLQERLQQCKAENSLLGSIVKDSQAECHNLKRQLKEAHSKTSQLQAEAKAKQKLLETEEQRAQEALQELQRVKATVSSQAASSRRQEERQRKLEDVIIDLKHELDTTQDEVAALKKEKAKKELKLRQAIAVAEKLREEISDQKERQGDDVVRSQRELETAVSGVEQRAKEAENMLREAHDSQIKELQARLNLANAECDTLRGENTQLCDRINTMAAQKEIAQYTLCSEKQDVLAKTQIVPGLSRSTDDIHAALKELQQRNKRLQLALARKHQLGLATHEQAKAEASERALQKTLQHRSFQESLTVREDLVQLSERMCAVVQLNAELMAEVSALTQTLQATEEKLFEARAGLNELRSQQVAPGCSRVLHGDPPESFSLQPSLDHLKRELDLSVEHTRLRVIEHEKQQLLQHVGDLQVSVRELSDTEQALRQLLAQSRDREATALKRLSQESSRIHSLEMMRLNDLRELTRLQSNQVFSQSFKLTPWLQTDRGDGPSSRWDVSRLQAMRGGATSSDSSHADLSLQEIADLRDSF